MPSDTATEPTESTEPSASPPARLPVVLVVIALVVPTVVGLGVVWSRWGGPGDRSDLIGLVAVPPERVVEGEAFDLPVLVSNRSDEPVTLHGIDLEQVYMRGFVLLRTEPGYTAQRAGPSFHTFDFEIEVPPGAEQRVVFRLQGVAAGVYDGEVELRLTGPGDVPAAALRTTVAPPASAPGSPGSPGGPDDGDPLIIQPAQE